MSWELSCSIGFASWGGVLHERATFGFYVPSFPWIYGILADHFCNGLLN